MESYSLEQVFIRKRGGQLELLLVLENPAGRRHREKLTFPTQNALEGVRRAAKHLAYRGNIEDVSKLRLRVEAKGDLKDDASLKRIFIGDFEMHAEDSWD